MALVLVRVDNRLVHGQILSAWVPALDAEALLVIDDEAAANTLVRSAMEIAIPPELRFEVAPVSRAAEALSRVPPAARTVVLFRDISDALRAHGSGMSFPRLNIGNVHHSHRRRPVTAAVYLSEEEFEQLEALVGQGVEVELRTLPREPPLLLPEIQRRLAAGESR